MDFEGSKAASVELLRRGYQHDHRPQCGLRVSPHFYNTDAELVAFMDELKAIRAGK
jgi:kynureninase